MSVRPNASLFGSTAVYHCQAGGNQYDDAWNIRGSFMPKKLLNTKISDTIYIANNYENPNLKIVKLSGVKIYRVSDGREFFIYRFVATDFTYVKECPCLT